MRPLHICILTVVPMGSDPILITGAGPSDVQFFGPFGGRAGDSPDLVLGGAMSGGRSFAQCVGPHVWLRA